MTRLVLREARLPGSEGLVDIEIVDGTVIQVHRAGLGPAAESRSLDGRLVLPGLWDNHVHFQQWAAMSRRLDVSSARSAAEVASMVGDRVGAVVAGETLIGYGFRDGLWPDAPTVAMLDAVSGAVPVVLVSGDLHCAWANGAAITRYAMPDSTRGLLREDACFALVASIDAVADEVMDGWVSDAAVAAAARGVVGVVDLEMTWSVDAWARRIASGTDALRIDVGVYRSDLDRAITRGLRTGDEIVDTHGLLRMGPFKIITDGSLNTRTAYCYDEYPGQACAHDHGMLTVEHEELVSLVDHAWRSGLVPAIHAIGDHANGLALDAYEAVGARGSIEHAQLLSPSDIGRFARLGVVASVQPEHAMDDRDIADRFWAGRTGRAFPLRALLDAGAMLAFGSDAPVAPIDPWVAIDAAVTRRRGERVAWHEEQRISVEEALRASTRPGTGPWAGAVADLVIVESDPFDGESSLRSMPVAATLVAGRFSYDAL